MYALEIENLNVFYEDLHALKDVNLKIKENEFLGIIGPNGGGKTTLIKNILGIMKPNSGKVKIFDKEVEEGKSYIGYVPQISNFDKEFPIQVKDVVLMGRLKGKLKFFRKYTKEDIKVAEKVMKKLEIFDLKDRQIGKLSGGQLQKVMIARALATEPKILVLDEPTASIDAQSRTHIYKVLKDLNKEKTIIVVTHDMEVISSYVNSIACLNRYLDYHEDGKLTEESLNKAYGCPVELIAHGKTPHRVLSKHGGEDCDRCNF